MTDTPSLLFFRQGAPGQVEILTSAGASSVVKSVHWERAAELAAALLFNALEARDVARNMEARVKLARDG